MSIAVTAANVRPINPFPGMVDNTVPLNATVTAGQLVYHDGTGWAVSVLTNATTGRAQGVALKGGASGDYVDVLVGPCKLTGWSGLTAGGIISSAAAGAVSHTAAQYSSAVGFALSTTEWYFTGMASYSVP